MYAGRTVEHGPVRQVFSQARHPYADALLRQSVRYCVAEEASVKKYHTADSLRETLPRLLDQYKLLAYILSGSLSGLAGALKVLVAQNASLTDVHFSMSGEVVLMTLVGGLGTIFGPIVGAFIIVAMQNYLAGFGQWVTVIQGVIFVACVLAFRRGIIGEIAHRFGKSL